LAQTKILSRLDRLEECGVYLKSAEACFFKLNQILGIKKRYSEVLTGMEEMEKVLQKTSFVDEAVEILKRHLIFSQNMKNLTDCVRSLVMLAGNLTRQKYPGQDVKCERT